MGLSLEITFAKKGLRDYQVVVKRDDGVLLKVQSFDRPIRLPHDMAHFVVENELRLEHGFWGLLAAGVLFIAGNMVTRSTPPLPSRTTI